jgi:lipopolysaccharide transport system ATP-binding protein
MGAVQSLCKRAILLQKGTLSSDGLVQEVIGQFLENEDPVLCVSYPHSRNKPVITNVALNQESLHQGNIHLSIEFSSPKKLTPPVPGVVIYSSTGIPVYGTNPRLHQPPTPLDPQMEGLLQCKIDSIPLLPGRYTMSVWLGDQYEDYDFRESALSFEFRMENATLGGPSSANIGHIDHFAVWTLEPALLRLPS